MLKVQNLLFLMNTVLSTAGDIGNVSTALHIIPEIGGNDYTYAFTAGLSPADANAKLDDGVVGAIKQALEVKIMQVKLKGNVHKLEIDVSKH